MSREDHTASTSDAWKRRHPADAERHDANRAGTWQGRCEELTAELVVEREARTRAETALRESENQRAFLVDAIRQWHGAARRLEGQLNRVAKLVPAWRQLGDTYTRMAAEPGLDDDVRERRIVIGLRVTGLTIQLQNALRRQP